MTSLVCHFWIYGKERLISLKFKTNKQIYGTSEFAWKFSIKKNINLPLTDYMGLQVLSYSSLCISKGSDILFLQLLLNYGGMKFEFRSNKWCRNLKGSKMDYSLIEAQSPDIQMRMKRKKMKKWMEMDVCCSLVYVLTVHPLISASLSQVLEFWISNPGFEFLMLLTPEIL